MELNGNPSTTRLRQGYGEASAQDKKLPAASPFDFAQGMMLSIATTGGLSVETNQGCGVSVWGVIWILKIEACAPLPEQCRSTIVGQCLFRIIYPARI